MTHENRISSSVEVQALSDNNHSDSEESIHSESYLSSEDPEDAVEVAFGPLAKRKRNENSSGSSSEDDSTKADSPNTSSTFKFQQGFRKKEKEVESSKSVFKEETYRKILELMESELSCSVCNEIFIQATVIECGHTFCGFCITEWSRTKYECPICRKRFINPCRHIQMENFITKMFESFNEEIASKRQASILDRENQVKRAEEEAARAQAARQNRGTRMGGNSPGVFMEGGFMEFAGVLLQPMAERDVDFLPGIIPQINEENILAPLPNSARGGAAAAGSDRRRSARIQARVVGDGVAPAVEEGTGGQVAVLVGRRYATRSAALPNPPSDAAAVRLGQIRALGFQNVDFHARLPDVRQLD